MGKDSKAPRPQIQPQAARHAGFFPDPVQASLSPASRLPITRGPPRSASRPPSPRVQTAALGPRRPGPRRAWEPPLPLDTAGPAPHLCFTALRAFSCCRVTLGWFLVEERRTEAPGEQVSFYARLSAPGTWRGGHPHRPLAHVENGSQEGEGRTHRTRRWTFFSNNVKRLKCFKK